MERNLIDDKFKASSPGQFFKFEKEGDSIQGTYVGQEVKTGPQYGPKLYYKIKKGNDLFFVKEFSTTRDIMQSMVLGTVVAFKFVKWQTPKKGGAPYKVVDVYFDKEYLDKEWLEHNEEIDTLSAFNGSNNDQEFKNTFGPTPAPVTTQVNPQALQVEPTVDKKGLILELATKKFGAEDTVNKMMNETGLVFIEKNYDALLDMLQ